MCPHRPLLWSGATNYLTSPPTRRGLSSVWGFRGSESACLPPVISRRSEAREEQPVPLQPPGAQGRSGAEVDNEQWGDKLELWRSYHPEPPGHTALLVVTLHLTVRVKKV